MSFGVRKKTEIELAEDSAGQAARLRHALFVIGGLEDTAEMKRIAIAAMAGELHGYEIPSPQTEATNLVE